MIGVLTFFQMYNYGAYLQAYALQKYLQQLGYSNELINYRSKKSIKNELHQVLTVDGNTPLTYLRIILKILKFRQYQKRLRKTSAIYSSAELAQMHYDTLIVGSDQIWCYSKEWGGFDSTYFSNNLTANKLVAYAASMGLDNYDKQHPRMIYRLMKNFKHLGLRDTNTLNFARITNPNEPTLVLDPTLLHDFTEECQEPKLRNYILFYSDGYLPDKAVIKCLCTYARKNKLKLVSVGKKFDWCDVNVIAASPFQWIGYFKQADFVFSCMYHGLLFSLKYTRNFAMFIDAPRENKCLDFLKRINLTDRICNDESTLISAFESPVNFEPVIEFLEKEKEVSRLFLENSLKK